MIDANLGVIATILRGIGFTMGFLGALFAFGAWLQNDRHEKTKAWFQTKWEGISQSRWRNMPEKVIQAVIRGKDRVSKFIVDDLGEGVDVGYIIAYIALLFCVGSWNRFDFVGLVIALIISCPTLIDILDEKIPHHESISNRFLRVVVKGVDHLSKRIPAFLDYLSFVLIPLGACWLWAQFALNQSLALSTLSMLLTLPAFLYIFLFPGSMALVPMESTDETLENTILLGQALGVSFVITLFAFLVGNLISPDAHVPQTWQMLISNVLLDGVTLLATFALITWAVREKAWLRIPIAILLDVLVACILAFASLYVGLVFTENELTVTAVFNILIGKAASGDHYELGPYFWAMHTTFLPTLAYLFIILVAWLGKTILIPFEWFLGKGKAHRNPLGLTATLFGLLASFFIFSAFWVDQVDAALPSTRIEQVVPRHGAQGY